MIISIAQAQLFFLALTRIMATIIHVPVLGGQAIPNQVKIAFGVVLAVVLIPWQPLPADAAAMGLFGFAVAIAKELIIGTLAGYASVLVFGAVTLAGEAMGLGSGFGSGRIFNPALADSGSSFNQLFVMVAMMYFLVINGHHVFLKGLEGTFQVIPVGGDIPLGSMDTLVKYFSELITAGIQMALPVMAALFMTDLSLGLLARVAPQVQVFFLGLPLKVGVSLFALGILFMAILPVLNNLFQSIGTRMLHLIGS